MKFCRKLSIAERDAKQKDAIRALETIVDEQRRQIADLRKLTRHQRRELARFIPATSKILERCKDCGRPTKVVITAMTSHLLPCATCGQGIAASTLLQTTVQGSGGPMAAGLGAASAQIGGLDV